MKKPPPPIFFKSAKPAPPSEGESRGPSDNYNIYINTNQSDSPMDATALAGKVYSLFLPFLKKSKSLSKITSDISEATNTTVLETWEKVKPIFIEEFEEEPDTLSSDVESSDIVSRELRKAIQKDENLKGFLEDHVKKVESQSGSIIQIGRGNVSVSGQITGNSGKVNIKGGGND